MNLGVHTMKPILQDTYGSTQVLSFGSSTLPLLQASLHLSAHQSLYEAIHLHPAFDVLRLTER